MKTGIIISDLHCGNVGGLCHPKYFHEDHRENQTAFWNWFIKQIGIYGPFDFCIADGDLVDGEGKKGTLDTIETNIKKQANNAVEIIQTLNIPADKIFLARGTPFHTNGVLEYEDLISDELGCSIKSTQKIEIEGWKIHARHVVGRSDIPYGQATPLLKELVRMEHEAFRDAKEAPDIIFRGHVHYDCHVGKHGRIAIDLPCLELPLGEANGRRYSAWEYDVGFGILQLDEKREPMYHPVIMPVKMYHEEGYQCVTW